jgi:tetratricopeptide (TPR) repeat protein
VLAAAAAVVAFSVLTAGSRQRVEQLRAAVNDARKWNAAGRHDEALRALDRGLAAATPGTVPEGLRDSVAAERLRAERGQKARELHELADLVRRQYGTGVPSGDEARRLIRRCQAVWAGRGRHYSPADRAADDAPARQARTDLIELAAVWADACVGLAETNSADAAREALKVLDEADASFGPSFAVAVRRDRLRDVLGEAHEGKDPPGPPVPRTAWEHADLGLYELRLGGDREAFEQFRRALELRPQDFWPNFHQGLCAYRLGLYHDAVAAFRTAAALEPRSAACYHNRALAYESLDRPDLAAADYSRAVELDPLFAEAYWNRGALRYEGGDAPGAATDFSLALQAPSLDASSRARLRFNLALAHLASGDRPAALIDAEASFRDGFAGARDLYEHLRDGRPVTPPSLRRPSQKAAGPKDQG